MPNNNPSPRDLLRSALQRTDDCPPPEALERLLNRSDATLAKHVDACAFCKTELELLRSFQMAEIPAEDAAAVNAITQRLNRDAIARPRPIDAPRKPRWTLAGSWVRTATLAAAAVLAIVAIGLQFRHNAPPALRHTTDSDVFRSQSVNILAPAGDLQTPPQEAHWGSAPAAASYQVRLLEVDGNQLWSATTTNTSVVFPPSVRALMVPAKTLTLVVVLFNAQGQKIAESPKVNFRILQKIYPR
jgi:hypothetical protein